MACSQCAEGLVTAETCRKEVRSSMRRSLHRFYELGIHFIRSESSFVIAMQQLTRLEGLPEINEDGTWQ